MMMVKRGRKNIESSNNVVVRIPQTTTTMILNLWVKVVVKVAPVRIQEHKYVEKVVKSITKSTHVWLINLFAIGCFSLRFFTPSLENQKVKKLEGREGKNIASANMVAIPSP